MVLNAGVRVASLAVVGLVGAVAASCVFELREPLDPLPQPTPDNVIWIQRYGDSVSQTANGVAIDSKGNLLIAGTFEGTLTFDVELKSKGSQDIFLVKLDPDGVPLWSRRFGGSDKDESGALGRGPNVAVDAAGNVLLAGAVMGKADVGNDPVPGTDIDSDPVVLKLDADGEVLWSKRFTGAGNQKAWSVGVDAEGSAFVTGEMAGTVDFGGGELTSAGDADLFVMKLDAAGEHVWSRRLGESGAQRGLTLAMHPDGDVVIAGELTGSMTFGAGEGLETLSSVKPDKRDLLLLKLDPEGKARWGRNFSKAETAEGILQGMGGVAVTPSGDILLTGWFHDTLKFDEVTLVSKGSSDLFIARLDNEGHARWAVSYGNEVDYQVGWGIASDAAGEVLVTGNLTGDVDIGPLVHKGFDMSTKAPDAYVLKLDAELGPIWNTSLTGPGWQVGYGIAVDPQGDVVVVGRMSADITSLDPRITSHGGDDMFVLKLSP